MRRPRRIILGVLLAALMLGAIFAAFWLGLVPQRYSPLPPVSLDEPPSWFVDIRLAALRHDPALCQAILRAPHIAATPVPDSPIKDGCGWVNAFRLRAVGEDMGAYSCRNMIGNSKWTNVRSEHALANAIDISGFKLADGRVITVAKNYKGNAPEAAFLHAAHMRACKYFRVAIGPEFNAAHWNHLHLDRGVFERCG